MAKIRYQRRHSVEPEVARRELRRLVLRFADKYKVMAQWEGEDRAWVCGRGVKGLVELLPGLVHFDLSISLLLTPFKSMIKRGIVEEVERALEQV